MNILLFFVNHDIFSPKVENCFFPKMEIFFFSKNKEFFSQKSRIFLKNQDFFLENQEFFLKNQEFSFLLIFIKIFLPQKSKKISPRIKNFLQEFHEIHKLLQNRNQFVTIRNITFFSWKLKVSINSLSNSKKPLNPLEMSIVLNVLYGMKMLPRVGAVAQCASHSIPSDERCNVKHRCLAVGSRFRERQI